MDVVDIVSTTLEKSANQFIYDQALSDFENDVWHRPSPAGDHHHSRGSSRVYVHARPGWVKLLPSPSLESDLGDDLQDRGRDLLPYFAPSLLSYYCGGNNAKPLFSSSEVSRVIAFHRPSTRANYVTLLIEP